MTTLIVGATGATGRLLVEQLLNRGEPLKLIVRSVDRLPDIARNNENVTIITAPVLDLSDAEMAQHVKGCNAIASCLGHNLTLKGLFGKPHKLVTDATRRLCEAVLMNNPEQPVKFVLMNTTGNRNRDLSEPISLGEKLVMALMRTLLPPQRDNEKAADYLRTEIGQNNGTIAWVAVRPDGLVDESEVTPYKVVPSPTRSAVFNAGTTSRINVAHFMVDLIIAPVLWNSWQGQMPVIYNEAEVN